MNSIIRFCRQPGCLLILLGVLWGSGYTLARYATTHGVSPLGYAFWQSFGPALILLLYILHRHEKMAFRWPTFAYFMLIGLIGIALPNTNMYFSAQHMPAGMLAVVVNTVPMFIYMLALLVGEEHWDIKRVFALLLLCVGLLLLVFPHFHLQTINLISPAWILMALLSPFLFALTAVFIANKPLSQSASVLACGMMFAATVWLLPVIVMSHSFYWPGSHWQIRDWAIIVEIILSSIGYIVFFQLLKLAGSVYYSFVSGVVAIMGIIWGQVLFAERFSSLDLIAMFCILFATTLVVVSSLKRR